MFTGTIWDLTITPLGFCICKSFLLSLNLQYFSPLLFGGSNILYFERTEAFIWHSPHFSLTHQQTYIHVPSFHPPVNAENTSFSIEGPSFHMSSEFYSINSQGLHSSVILSSLHLIFLLSSFPIMIWHALIWWKIIPGPNISLYLLVYLSTSFIAKLLKWVFDTCFLHFLWFHSFFNPYFHISKAKGDFESSCYLIS